MDSPIPSGTCIFSAHKRPCSVNNKSHTALALNTKKCGVMCTAQETAGICARITSVIHERARLASPPASAPPPPNNVNAGLPSHALPRLARRRASAARRLGVLPRPRAAAPPRLARSMLAVAVAPETVRKRKTGWHKAPVVMPRLACDACRAQWVPMMNTDLQETDEAIFDIVEHEETRQ